MSKCDFQSQAKHRITIQSPSEVDTASGGRTSTFVNQSTIWAIIMPMSGREIYTNQAVQSRVTHKMIIRYQAALKDVKTSSDYRISFDNRFFGIQSMRNLDEDMKSEGKDFQEFLCEENGADING